MAIQASPLLATLHWCKARQEIQGSSPAILHQEASHLNTKGTHNLASLRRATHWLLFHHLVIIQWGIRQLVILDIYQVLILLQRMRARRNITDTYMLAIRPSTLEQQLVILLRHIRAHPWTQEMDMLAIHHSSLELDQHPLRSKMTTRSATNQAAATATATAAVGVAARHHQRAEITESAHDSVGS